MSPIHMFRDDGGVVYRFQWINTLPCWVAAKKVGVWSYAHLIFSVEVFESRYALRNVDSGLKNV